MKIALLGYGRMGKAIEEKAVAKGHEIVYRAEGKIIPEEVIKADVAIDFSVPKAAFDNISTCLKNNIPVVSGTTGWLDQYEEAVALCQANKGAFLYASNYSLGVNLFFELNERLAKMMKSFEAYDLKIEEIHHTKKLDAPSGTAITLADQIIEQAIKKQWTLVEKERQLSSDKLPITAKRIPEVPGTHTVTYNSPIDSIEIKHTAHSRDGFALGALHAAEWIHGKTGVFSMKDVLKSIFL